MGVNLGDSHFNNMEGVYIIWQGGGPIIRVGQGTICDRLAAHRDNEQSTAHEPLYSSWAPVGLVYRNGVERYLANTLRPIVGSAFPDVPPIEVNLPWVWRA